VVLTSDAGLARRAARRPVVGSKRVQQLLKGGWRLFGFKTRPGRDELDPARLLDVNSSPSLVLDGPEGLIVITAEAVENRITSIWSGSTRTKPQRSRIRRP
jgi:hypothetical protein